MFKFWIELLHENILSSKVKILSYKIQIYFIDLTTKTYLYTYMDAMDLFALNHSGALFEAD